MKHFLFLLPPLLAFIHSRHDTCNQFSKFMLWKSFKLCASTWETYLQIESSSSFPDMELVDERQFHLWINLSACLPDLIKHYSDLTNQLYLDGQIEQISTHLPKYLINAIYLTKIKGLAECFTHIKQFN